MEAIKAIQKLKSRLHNYLVPQSIYMLCDEAIAELEALQQRSCDGCVREVEDMVDPHCAFCSRACKDNYESKEQ